MTVHLDHTGYAITLKGPAGPGNFSKIVMPAGSPNVGQSLSVSTLIGGALTLGFTTVNGLPSGGSSGELLRKTLTGYEWYELPPSIPNGGTTGQALVKASASDYDVAWQTVSGGGGIGGSLDLGAVDDTSTSVDLGSVADAVGTSPLTLVLQP